ncbi:MAG TPA: ABC transporter permease [Thermomicrobiales bacterium]|nr:ABC transporter permease [Thermomicrobiales bacterium]
MSRGQYILRRLVQMIPVLIGVTIIIFALIRAIPGDPAVAMLGDRATNDAIERMRESMGLNEPLYVQYWYFVRDLAQLDLGTSTRYDVPVSEILFARLKVSLSVVLYTTVLTILISVPLGILAALKKDSIFDNIVRSALMVTLVMPSFWMGIMFIILFSVKLGVFPVSGYGQGFFGHLRHLFLPSLTVSLTIAPILIRALRNSILEVLDMDYVKTARAKGLTERTVMTIHVLRNALIPAVTLLGISIGGLMGGTVITEKVFSLPGAGALLIDSITARDYAMLQGATLIFASMVILVNLATDILYSFLDPRVRF